MQTYESVGVKIIVTGQSGIDKEDYLRQVVKQDYIDRGKQRRIIVNNIGEEMYSEAQKIGGKISPGKILNLPLLRLGMIRRSVFKDAILYCSTHPNENIIVNTHSCFRWERGLFSAFDFDLLRTINPEIYVTIIDDVDAIYLRLSQGEDPHVAQFSLKDILVWREEEMITTEIIAKAHDKPHYVVARKNPIDTIHKLMFDRSTKKSYLSFPITKVLDKPEVKKEIEKFRSIMAQHMIVFDPYAISEKNILRLLSEAEERGDERITVNTNGNEQRFDTQEIKSIAKDINGQIIARDYKLIEQSDMVVAYIPEVNGEPDISAGVQSELQYAHDLPRQVYVIWPSSKEPSVWIEGMATNGRIFRGKSAIDDALEYFKSKGFITLTALQKR